MIEYESIKLKFLSLFPGFYDPHILPKQSFFYNDSRVWIPVWSFLGKLRCPLINTIFTHKNCDYLKQYALCLNVHGFVASFRSVFVENKKKIKCLRPFSFCFFSFNLANEVFDCWEDESYSVFSHSGDVMPKRLKSLVFYPHPGFLML